MTSCSIDAVSDPLPWLDDRSPWFVRTSLTRLGVRKGNNLQMRGRNCTDYLSNISKCPGAWKVRLVCARALLRCTWLLHHIRRWLKTTRIRILQPHYEYKCSIPSHESFEPTQEPCILHKQLPLASPFISDYFLDHPHGDASFLPLRPRSDHLLALHLGCSHSILVLQ